MGELLLGLGDGARARTLLERSAKLAPEDGASKWLYLGQMEEGWQALQHFSKGAELLKAELTARRQGQGQGAQAQEGGLVLDDETFAIMNQLVSAQCSIAELYLTDLCFEEDAETRCQAALDAAVEMDVGGSPEVTQALANLRLSQQKGEDAAVLMLETVKRLQACQQEDIDGDMDDEEEEAQPKAGVLPLPNLMFRVQTGKLLLECQAYHKRCAKKAVQVLEACKCEDDENMEVWYLLGVAYMAQRVPDLEMAMGHLLYAQEAMKKMQKQQGGGAIFPYADHLRLVEEQLALVKDMKEKGVGQCEEEAATMVAGDSSSSSEEDEEEEEEEATMEN